MLQVEKEHAQATASIGYSDSEWMVLELFGEIFEKRITPVIALERLHKIMEDNV